MATAKLEIACELLDCALRLYYEGDSFFAVIQLAGGAEELLGKHLELIGKKPAFHEHRDLGVAISQMGGPSEAVTPSEMADALNLAKNAVKHIGPPGELTVAFDSREEARDLLDRAVSNYYQLLCFSSLEETPLIARFNREILGQA